MLYLVKESMISWQRYEQFFEFINDLKHRTYHLFYPKPYIYLTQNKTCEEYIKKQKQKQKQTKKNMLRKKVAARPKEATKGPSPSLGKRNYIFLQTKRKQQKETN